MAGLWPLLLVYPFFFLPAVPRRYFERARRTVWLKTLYIQAARLQQELEEYTDDLEEALKVCNCSPVP